MAKRLVVALASAPIALAACHSSEEDLPTAPPKSVTQVAIGGFTAPSDAVASPDGRMFYFTAYDAEKQPGVFEVSATPGSAAQPIVLGAPLAMPIGLVMSCDGKTLYVVDAGGEDGGTVFSIGTSGDGLIDLRADGIERPGGIAMGPDCRTLYITGRTNTGAPALFSLPTAGATTSVVYQGEPLVSPTGLFVDRDGVAWVLDHLAHGVSGEGVLFAIPSDGSAATEIASSLRMGTPGGCSLTAGGGTAVVPTRREDGRTQLTSISIATGEIAQLETPDISDVGGLRTARSAGVFAVVDTEAGAIYRAE